MRDREINFDRSLPENKSPADYIIYKGKAALQFTLNAGKPEKVQTRKGIYYGTNKGCIFLAAANARGRRDYDWDNKVTIGLSEHEVGKLICGLKGTKQEFYHDTNKGRDGEGQLIKTMTVSPSGDKKKLFINITQTRDGKKFTIEGVPIEREEAVALTELLKTAIPKILGWS